MHQDVSMEKIVAAIIIATLGFLIKEILTWIYFRIKHQASVKEEIERVLADYRGFDVQLETEKPNFGIIDNKDLRYFWNAEDERISNAEMNSRYLDSTQQPRCSRFYQSLARASSIMTTYNDLVTKFFSTNDPTIRAELKRAMKGCYSDLTSEHTELMEAGNEAVGSLK